MKIGDVLYNKNPIHKFLWFYRGETEYGYNFDVLLINNETGYATLSKKRFVPYDNFANVKKNLVTLDPVDYEVVFDAIFIDIDSYEVDE